MFSMLSVSDCENECSAVNMPIFAIGQTEVMGSTFHNVVEDFPSRGAAKVQTLLPHCPEHLTINFSNLTWT